MSALNGKVATSIPQWADMIRNQLGISGTNPEKNDEIWAVENASWTFSSGSDLELRDYLLLRVIWVHHDNTNAFVSSMRDNPYLKDGPYRGFVSPENDALATQIYHLIKSKFEGYLADVHSNKDGTRPTLSCGMYAPTRFWQAMAVTKIKKYHTTREVAALPKKVQKKGPPITDRVPVADFSDDDEAAVEKLTVSMATLNISKPPSTPVRRGPGPQLDLSTPAVPKSYPAVGGSQNPATTDECYVNTAILLFVQQLLFDMRQLTKQFPKKFTKKILGFDLDALDWLADRLSLKLYSCQPGSDPLELMESRVDGYLSMRSSKAGETPAFSNLPLAIIEAKACVRRAGASPIRWQESAEVCCWVSSLPEEWEHYGLLQSSTSGRKRRLLISQDRHEIYIIVAEYGEPWKEYTRTGSSPAEPTARTQVDAKDLAGSDACIRNIEATPLALAQHNKRLATAVELLPADSPKGPTTRQTRAQKELKLLGHDHFCYMHEWGPFDTTSEDDMDLFLRRMVALQIQLLSTASAPAAPV